jgi:hypothetical protein
MANLKTEVILTMNGKAAIQVLEALTEKARAVREEIDNLDKNAPDYSKRKAGLEEVHKALLSAETDVIKGTERLDHAIQNLSSTSLQNLRKALGDGRRQLQSLSEDELEEAEVIRKKMKLVGDEIRLIEGQYVKIAEGLADVENQSDQWLDKAIKQQRDLVGSLKKTDESYYQNLVTLKKLENEEDKRKNLSKMSVLDASHLVDSRNATPAELRRAKAAFIEARDREPIGNSAAIDSYNRYLREIEKQLETVSGKAQKASLSWKQMRQVLAEPNKASGEDIKRTMDAIQQKIQQLPAGSRGVADLRRQYAMLEQTLKGTRMSQSQLNDILSRSKQGKASLGELRRAYKQLEDELNQINTKSEEFAKKQESMKKLKKNIDEVTGAANKQRNAWSTAVKNLVAYVGLFGLFNQVKSMITGLIKKNLDYSGSLTDIRKVAGLAKEDIDDLSRSLAKIDTRTSTEGLAQLAYQGAKLGMSKYGVEGMAGFVRAADQINVAIGEEMGDEALPALSKMVEVMGLIPKMGIEKALLATGSAMFKLSTSSTAISGNITEFAKRLTGVSRTAGITTDQLLALASSADSMMLMPEVASTAMSKFIVALQKNHNLIERDLDIQKGTIKSYYEQGRAIDAVVLVLEKMKEKGNMNVLGDIFKDLGSDGQRLVTSMVTMSKNVDILKEHLEISNEAFREGTAVTSEYEMQQQSAIGTLERANNLWEKAFVNPDGVDLVKELAQTWYDMSKSLTENAVAMKSLRYMFEAILASCKILVYILPGLVAGLLLKGVSAAIYGVWMGLEGVGDAAFIATVKTEGLKAAWQKLNYTMKANWISLIIGLLVELGVVLYNAFKKSSDLASAQLDINQYVKEGAAAWDKEKRKLDSYVSALSSANTSTAQRQRLLKNFNREYKPYLDKLGIEVQSVKDLKGAYSKLNEEIRKKMYYQIKEKAYDTELGKAQGNVGKAVMDYSKYINSEKGSTWAAYDTKYLQDQINRGKSAIQIYRNMVMDVYGKSGVWSGYNGDYILQTGSVRDSRLKGYIENFVNAQKGYNRTKKTIDNALNPLIGDYDPFATDDPGTLENDALDKDAIRQTKQEKRDRERSWREELKQKQDEANAIMDNVRNFYERQINAKMQEAIGLGMDETEQNLLVEPVKRRMNQALEQLRLAIAGKANTWEQFKLTMKDDLIEQTDETGVNLSEGLLKGITSYNIDALRAKLNELGNSLKRPLNSIFAEVFAKATKSAQDNLTLESKQKEARRKAIMEHDYTGVVQQGSYDAFNTLGYANPTAAEVKNKADFDKRKENIIAMFEKARKEIASVFDIDVSNEEGRGMLMKLLFGDDPDGLGKRISETLGTSAAEWEAFYQKLIQYNDEYESASKKGDDERKKLNDYGWSKDATQKEAQAVIDYQDQQNKETSRQYSFGAKGDTILPWGQTEATDPELALLKLKYDLAKEYYKYIEDHSATDEQKIEAAQKIASAHESIMDAVTKKAKATADAQMKWYKPIEEYGSALGDALTDESKSVKDATKSMISSFIDLTGEYVQQKLTQWVMTKLYNSLMATSEQELVTSKQVAASENATTAVTEAGVEVAAGTASGAAKTIGELGWWGIPLIAVIGAVLGGLLSFAKGALSNAFGGNKNNNDTKRNFKVTSGMLTYDSGNVQDLRPFVGNDGSIYWATEDNKPHDGVSLLTQPTATTINGHPSLVAENGPELVIGRETTQAMMMNNPQLLKALVNYDRNYSGRRAYDTGNVAESSATIASGTPTPNDVGVSQADTNLALLQAIGTLMQRLNEPIEARIDMYGRGNLYESMTKANRFMKRK